MRKLRSALKSKLARRAIAALLLALVLPTVEGRAEITPIEQERFARRTVRTISHVDTDMESAPDFGHFEGGIYSTSQTSDIVPVLGGELNAAGWASGGAPEDETYTSGLSSYRVEFDVDETTTYALMANLQADDDYWWGLGVAKLTLSVFDADLGEYQDLLDYTAVADVDYVVSETGTFEPGRYQLEVSASGNGMIHSYFGGLGGSSHATFSLTTPRMGWATIGDQGNAPDIHGAGYGSVEYLYQITKYEVTNAQYAEFLSAVAAADTYELYSPLMDASSHGGISRSGSSGSYAYSARAGMAEKPVTYVSFYDSLRFANWMHNGQPTGAQRSNTTEDGAYDLSLGSTVARKQDAKIFLPSEDEWYKAAYYDAISTSYFDYPAGSDTQTSCPAPGVATNTANCDDAVGTVTVAGSYIGSASPSGTFDQGGNVREWSEAAIGSNRVLRGGSFTDSPSDLAASERGVSYPTNQYSDVGFRIATIDLTVPEPAAATLQAAALTLLMMLRRRAAHIAAA